MTCWFKRKARRLELRFVTYAEADVLIKATKGAWTLAPEEDDNTRLGMVWLELLADAGAGKEWWEG